MPRIEAIVEAEVIRWARESAGLNLEEAAKKARVKTEQLAAWEDSEARPTINQMRRIAHACKRPLAVFFLPEPPRDFQALRDFRRLPEAEAKRLSAELRFEVRLAHARRETALEMYEFMGTEPPLFSLRTSLADNPEEVGLGIRRAAGVSLEMQVAWGDPRVAFNEWRAALERAGVLVFQASGVDTEEMRGFSLADRPLAVVVVNVRDAYAGRTFSMFHELAHIMLDTGGLCDLEEHRDDASREQQVEVFCNRVAAAALMPRAALLGEQVVLRNQGAREWPDDDTRRLARRYGVSREALLRRLLALGRVSAAHYQRRREELQQEYRRWRASRSAGYRDWVREPITKAGRSFVLLVMACYNEGRITLVDASQALGVKAETLAKVEAELRFG